MDPAEYLAFIPLLIYGIALADLLGQWRRFFDQEYFYFPYFLTTIIFTEAAVWNVYLYLEIVSNLEGVSYAQYWSYLIQPLLFLITVSALTPESDDKNTEGYFKEKLSLIYFLVAVFVLSHTFSRFGSFSQEIHLNYMRFVLVALSLAIALTKKIWLIYAIVPLWLLSLLLRMAYS